MENRVEKILGVAAEIARCVRAGAARLAEVRGTATG